MILALSEWAKRTSQSSATLRKRKQRNWTDLEIILGKRLNSSHNIIRDQQPRNPWPEGVRVSDWERHYRDWLKARGNPLAEDTRSVFYAWVEQSAIRSLQTDLARTYPDIFGAEASPDAADNPDAENDPRYRVYLERFQRLQPVLRSLSPAERSNLLRLKRRSISDPRAAVESERKERARYKR